MTLCPESRDISGLDIAEVLPSQISSDSEPGSKEDLNSLDSDKVTGGTSTIVWNILGSAFFE